MKYVVLGSNNDFRCIGVKTAHFVSLDSTCSEVYCELECDFVLNLIGNSLYEVFKQFIYSDASTAVLVDDESNSLQDDGYIELLNSSGDVVYRY